MIDKQIHEMMGLCWHEAVERTLHEREPIIGWFGQIKGYRHSSIRDECMKCGVKISPYYYTNGKTGEQMVLRIHENCHRYSTAISEAFDVVDWLREKGYRVTMRVDNGGNEATIWIPNEEGDTVASEADTLPLAICQAALKLNESNVATRPVTENERDGKTN
jgi:hypothetical protein